MRRSRLRWHGHVKECISLVQRNTQVGRPRKAWQNTLSADMLLLKVYSRHFHDRNKRQAIERRKANTAASGKPPENVEEGDKFRLYCSYAHVANFMYL